jgi:hypothetical protein
MITLYKKIKKKMEDANLSESKKEFNNDDFDESYDLTDNCIFDFFKNDQKETRIFEFNGHSNNNTGNQTISLTFLNSFKNQNISTTKIKRKKKNITDDKINKNKKKEIKGASNNEKRPEKKFGRKRRIVIDESSLDTTIPNDKMKIENNL